MKHKFLSFVLFSVVFCIGYFLAFRTEISSIDLGSKSDPQQRVEIPKDLLQGAKEFLNFVSDPNGLTYQNCAQTLQETYADFYRINPEHFDRQSIKNHFKEIIRTIFMARIQLREKLRSFPIAESSVSYPEAIEDMCVSRARDIFRLGRYLEDFLGEMYLGVKPFDEATDPKFIDSFAGDEPWLIKSPKIDKINFRSGDIITSRGNAYTSAAIARIGEIDSQFSHVALVYVDGDEGLGKTYALNEAIKSDKVLILEAHIEIGTTIRSFKKYLEDGNARNALFRYSDSKVAHQAAKFAYQLAVDHVEKAYKNRYSVKRPTEILLPKNHPDFHIPYDFKMDLSNAKEIFCSEIASVAYGSQQVIVPFHLSALSPASENDLVKVLGMASKTLFAPGDMEVDPHFELLGEWRDYRKLRNIRFKDAVLTSMYDWMKSAQYKFQPQTLVSGGALVYSFLRKLDFPLPKGLSEKLPKNMSGKIAATVETLNRTAEFLQRKLETEELAYQKDHDGLLLSLPLMKEKLEAYRQMDASLFEAGKKSDFHKMFRPPALKSN